MPEPMDGITDAMRERAAIVAWLRSESRRISDPGHFVHRMALALAANSIEAGEHRDGK